MKTKFLKNTNNYNINNCLNIIVSKSSYKRYITNIWYKSQNIHDDYKYMELSYNKILYLGFNYIFYILKHYNYTKVK